MDRSGLQRLVPIVFVLIIIVVAVAALISVGRTIFFGDSPQEPQQSTADERALVNTEADRSVRMTVRGPIVASENHHSYTITVTPSKRVMTTYNGYVGDQVDRSERTNNVRAYEEFVYALDREEMMDGTPFEGEQNDTRGICPTGFLYEFETLKDSETVEKLWITTCNNIDGSLDAKLSQVRKMFQVQIPNYTQLVSAIDMTYGV